MVKELSITISVMLLSVSLLSCGTETNFTRSSTYAKVDNNDIYSDNATNFDDKEKYESNIDEGNENNNQEEETTPPPRPSIYDWTSHIVFTSIPKQRDSISSISRISTTEIFHDIFKYARNSDIITSYDAITNIHETLHMLQHSLNLPYNIEKYIYYKEGQGAIAKEPSIKTKDIEKYVTDKLKRQIVRYSTYVAQRPNDPLLENVFDEWNAYLVDSLAALQMEKAGISRGNAANELDSSVEFLIVCSAAIVGVYKEDQSYSDFEQFKAIYAMLVDKYREVIAPALETSLVKSPSAVIPMLKDFLDYNSNNTVLATLEEIFGTEWFEAKILLDL